MPGLQIVRHRRLPFTTIPRTLIDVAATEQFADLRHMLANADYQRLLSAPDVEAQLRRGGPARPRQAVPSVSTAPRYSHQQVTRRPGDVAADLRQALGMI